MAEISFIVPACNNEGEIAQCLDSLARLTGDVEFIVVDDGSTDGTGRICDGYGAKDPRFSVVHQANQGVSVARNEGIRRATGRWLFFVDGDDYVDPEALQKQVIPRLDPACEIAYFHYDELLGDRLSVSEINHREVIDLRGERILGLRCATMNRDYPPMRDIVRTGINTTAPWAKAYRADFIRDNGFRFRPGLIRAQDQVFNATVQFALTHAQVIPGKGYVYRGRAARAYPYNPRLLENDAMLLEAYRTLFEGKVGGELLHSYRVWLACHIIFMLRLEFCNPTNPAPYRRRRAALWEYVRLPVYDAALAGVGRGDVRRSRWIILWLLKRRWFLPLDIYYRSTRVSALFQRLLHRLGC